jgi:hypothetical protein
MRASIVCSMMQLNAAAAAETHQMPKLATAMRHHRASDGTPGTAITMPMKAQKTINWTTLGLVKA